MVGYCSAQNEGAPKPAVTWIYSRCPSRRVDMHKDLKWNGSCQGRERRMKSSFNRAEFPFYKLKDILKVGYTAYSILPNLHTENDKEGKISQHASYHTKSF